MAARLPAAVPSFGLGDPAPWFGACTLAGERIDLHVEAGRWVVLAFAGALDDARAAAALRPLRDEGPRRDGDELATYIVLETPPPDPALVMNVCGAAATALIDPDGAIAALYGAHNAPRTIVLDPMLRLIANIAWDEPQNHAATLAALIRALPRIDDSAGVPLTAPALIVPRVLDFALCDLLVRLYEAVGGEDSGFLLDRDGKTTTMIDHALKRRRDMVVALPELRERLRQQIVRRLVPAISRYFQFEATRMDRYLVSCYDSATGGHFFRHRDNINAGAAHRRFAVSINLDGDYEGCDLVFPEFGRRPYRAPVGGAVVFSCGALHEVTPIRRGRRHAFLPFLYGEADAALRQRNNERLGVGEAPYRDDGHDRLDQPEPMA